MLERISVGPHRATVWTAEILERTGKHYNDASLHLSRALIAGGAWPGRHGRGHAGRWLVRMLLRAAMPRTIRECGYAGRDRPAGRWSELLVLALHTIRSLVRVI